MRVNFGEVKIIKHDIFVSGPREAKISPKITCTREETVELTTTRIFAQLFPLVCAGLLNALAYNISGCALAEACTDEDRATADSSIWKRTACLLEIK